VSQENDQPVRILTTVLVEEHGDQPFVAIVRSRDEFRGLLRDPVPGLQWLQVEGLLGDPDAWVEAAQGDSDIPLDVVLSDPASEYSDLYRLVDACAVRDIRVTIPAAPGLFKAIKLAAALRLPVRVLPGQPTAEALAELNEALDFYLHGPMVEAPVEFFHTLLAGMSGANADSLWMVLEEDPAAFLRYDANGQAGLPRSGAFEPVGIASRGFVENHFNNLVEPCRGYFKWPDPDYSCEGVKQLFAAIRATADDIGRELATCAVAKTGRPI
jgi:hypothetical protein